MISTRFRCIYMYYILKLVVTRISVETRATPLGHNIVDITIYFSHKLKQKNHKKFTFFFFYC